MNHFKPSEPRNFPTGPMMPFKVYLKLGLPGKSYFSFGQYSHIHHLFFCMYINTFVRICWLYRMCCTERVQSALSFKQGIYTANCGLLHFYALRSLCSNFKLGIWCVYLYIAMLESTCNCKPLGSDSVWTSGLTTCFQLEMKHHLADRGFKTERDGDDIL